VFSPEKEGSQITVGMVREIKKTIFLLPSESEKKVYIIKEGQKMNIPAQNALLKFLEEPPASSVIFILTEKKESLLPTVVSRCRIISLSPSRPEEIAGWLKGAFPKKTEEEIESAVMISGGSPGRAKDALSKSTAFSRSLQKDVFEFSDLVFSQSGGGKSALVMFFKQRKYDRIKAKAFLELMLSQIETLIFKNNLNKGGNNNNNNNNGENNNFKLVHVAEEALGAYEKLNANSNINLTLAAFASRAAGLL